MKVQETTTQDDDLHGIPVLGEWRCVLSILMETCLSEDLTGRPTAAELKVLMSKTINMNKSIVEETLRQLQEYAESLEDRTRDLNRNT